MKRSILLAVVSVTIGLSVLASPAAASGERAAMVKRLTHSKHVLAFFANPKHLWLSAPRKEKCWQVRWQKTCRIARGLIRDHQWKTRTIQRKLWYTLPATGDWQTAVRIVQRLYPGTADWMLSISAREGGYGRWVWYGGRSWSGYHIGDDFLGADTVGGWMQFRFSTFAPYWRGAIKDLRRRGFVVPEFPNRGGPEVYQPWLDPLGQALTAGYMRYYGKDGCHWCI
jgi:hypothetical protein